VTVAHPPSERLRVARVAIVFVVDRPTHYDGGIVVVRGTVAAIGRGSVEVTMMSTFDVTCQDLSKNRGSEAARRLRRVGAPVSRRRSLDPADVSDVSRYGAWPEHFWRNGQSLEPREDNHDRPGTFPGPAGVARRHAASGEESRQQQVSDERRRSYHSIHAGSARLQE